jgi:lysozyme
MKPSPRCEAFIKAFEKCRLKAYLPTKNDVPTIGWGSTGPDIKLGMVWTQAQADARFAQDLARFGAGVLRLLDGAPTTQGQFDAMVSFAYNVGLDEDADTKAEGFGDSTLLKKHKAGDYAGAAAQFKFWNKQKGVVLAGLTRRRADETAMYLAKG